MVGRDAKTLSRFFKRQTNIRTDTNMWQVDLQRQSIGPLYIGMPEAECLALFETPRCRVFPGRPGIEHPFTILNFVQPGFSVVIEYNRCVATIAVRLPIQVTLNGVELLGRDPKAVANELEETGHRFRRIRAGLMSESAPILLIVLDGVTRNCQMNGRGWGNAS
jgi:hypothetical protein